MKKKFKASKKSMRALITILISLVCINGALMVATIFAYAAVTPVVTENDANASNNFIASRVIEFKATNIEANSVPVAISTEKTTASTKQETSVPQTDSTGTTATNSTIVNKTTNNTNKDTTTTIKSSTTAIKAVSTNTTTTKAKQTSTSSSSTKGISTLRNSVNSSLINAFDELKFKVVVNPNSSYLGYFSTSRHSLEMRTISVGTFRHEMGHFLDVLKNMPSRSSNFAGIFAREKNDYTGVNATYITKNAQEYFAQSYRNYLENSSKLKSERPETYAFVRDQVTSITSTDINRTYNMYSWSW